METHLNTNSTFENNFTLGNDGIELVVSFPGAGEKFKAVKLYDFGFVRCRRSVVRVIFGCRGHFSDCYIF